MASSEQSYTNGPSSGLKLYQAFIFSVPIFFTFILLLLFYLFYLRRRRVDWASLRMRSTVQVDNELSSAEMGLQKEVREMLPIIIYRESFSVKDTQCSVCLGDYQAEEKLQQIPACGHVFHMDCIDNWLSSHTTCPLCRLSLLAKSESPNPSEDSVSEISSYHTSGQSSPGNREDPQNVENSGSKDGSSKHTQTSSREERREPGYMSNESIAKTPNESPFTRQDSSVSETSSYFTSDSSSEDNECLQNVENSGSTDASSNYIQTSTKEEKREASIANNETDEKPKNVENSGSMDGSSKHIHTSSGEERGEASNMNNEINETDEKPQNVESSGSTDGSSKHMHTSSGEEREEASNVNDENNETNEKPQNVENSGSTDGSSKHIHMSSVQKGGEASSVNDENSETDEHESITEEKLLNIFLHEPRK